MTQILVTDFIIVLLIFLRIFSALMAAPPFSNSGMPIISRVFMSIVIAYILFLTINSSTIQVEISMTFIAINAVKEIITGLILGFMLNFVFYGVLYSGTLIGFDMGISIAEMFNPAEGLSGNAIGELLYFGAMLIFLLINGHYYLIEGLSYSFTTIPIGYTTVKESVMELIVKYSAQVFVIAVKIASPILVSFFLLHIAEGIIARIIPQMQVFFVTQPLKIGLGFLLLASITPIFVYVIKNLLQSYEEQLFQIIQAMR